MNDHRHGGHSHERSANARRLSVVLALSSVYMVAEVVGGLITGSLALLADAGHMLSDVASLALALFAIWIAQRPADSHRTFGHTRAEILAALANGVALVVVAVLVVVEAVERISSPVSVLGLPMLVIATGGLVVNLVGMAVLGAGHHSLNMRGAFLHVMGDALGSVGAIVAGAVIWRFGWVWADAAVSIGISCLLVFSAWFLLREAINVLMEAVPKHLKVEDIRHALLGLSDVDAVHDLHVWTIGSSEVSLSIHVVPSPGALYPELLARVQAELSQRFEIEHATIQIEPDADACAKCDEPIPRASGDA